MATASVLPYEKKLKIYFTALWPVGPQFIKNAERDVISRDFRRWCMGRTTLILASRRATKASSNWWPMTLLIPLSARYR